VLVTILLFKIKVVLCVITHHHRHRFEKKIKIRERSQRRSIVYETTAEEHVRRWKKQTSLVRKKKTQKHHLKRKKERKNKKERVAFVPSAWLGARTAFQPTSRVFILFYRVVAVLVFLTRVLFLSFPFFQKKKIHKP
jgi:hypothetical protein